MIDWLTGSGNGMVLVVCARVRAKIIRKIRARDRRILIDSSIKQTHTPVALWEVKLKWFAGINRCYLATVKCDWKQYLVLLMVLFEVEVAVASVCVWSILLWCVEMLSAFKSRPRTYLKWKKELKKNASLERCCFLQIEFNMLLLHLKPFRKQTTSHRQQLVELELFIDLQRTSALRLAVNGTGTANHRLQTRNETRIVVIWNVKRALN